MQAEWNQMTLEKELLVFTFTIILFSTRVLSRFPFLQLVGNKEGSVYHCAHTQIVSSEIVHAKVMNECHTIRHTVSSPAHKLITKMKTPMEYQ